MLIYTIGLLGNLLFGIKSLFQVITCVEKHSTEGLSVGMLITDFLGNILCASFIFLTTGFTLWPQFVNYTLATLWLIILLVLKISYKSNKV